METAERCHQKPNTPTGSHLEMCPPFRIRHDTFRETKGSRTGSHSVLTSDSRCIKFSQMFALMDEGSSVFWLWFPSVRASHGGPCSDQHQPRWRRPHPELELLLSRRRSSERKTWNPQTNLQAPREHEQAWLPSARIMPCLFDLILPPMRMLVSAITATRYTRLSGETHTSSGPCP